MDHEVSTAFRLDGAEPAILLIVDGEPVSEMSRTSAAAFVKNFADTMWKAEQAAKAAADRAEIAALQAARG